MAALGILVKHDRVPRRVEVVAVREAANSDGNLLSLEDHGLVGVVGHAELEVAAGEAKAGGPEGLKLRHVPDCRYVLWLRSVAQALDYGGRKGDKGEKSTVGIILL